MKKILTSALVLVATVSAVALGTSAYFSDTETSTNNTFTTGTIDISVDGENPWENIGHFDIADMKPSTVFHREVTLSNTGNNPVNLWKKVTDINYDGGEHPESELAEDPNDNINDIGSAIRYDMSLDGEEIIAESDNFVMDDGSNQLDNTTAIHGKYIYLGRIEPGMDMVVTQSYHMDASVTNWAQGDVMTFDVEFYAQQTSGGAPAPGDELAGHALGDLDYLDIGLMASADMLVHDAQGWMDDTGVTLDGNYGSRDGGETIAMVWGEAGTCTEPTRNATFQMNAGTAAASKLALRHLDGSGDDSFEVFVNGVSAGTYAADQTSSETWYTTEFDLPAGTTGALTVEIIFTADAWSGCGTWGQLALNWAQLVE
ncbi:MAG: TasA family protein [Patescibacteria group bacterium]|nr:TasA family protein [Patescibacteria group bacterium]